MPPKTSQPKSALSVGEARARILAGVTPLPSEPVALLAARARILAEPIAARLTQPPFDASAMDGYAVRAADVARLPATLRVVGEAAAGHGFGGHVGPGEAARIFTGAPLPAGSDAIVIQENTRREGDHVVVHDGTPDPEHVRGKGHDFRLGDALLAPGIRLDARLLTLAAAMGHGVLQVRRRPVVAVLATGDELVEPGVAPGPDQIVCSNPYGLAALIEGAGGEARLLGIAGDTTEALEERIRAARGADILVTTGGASVGDHDLVAPVLQRCGMTLDFWKIAMRPGKPLIFGRMGPTAVLGLPGNPISSLVCARVFLVPLIRTLLGTPDTDAETRATLSADIPANGPRQHYMRGITSRDPDGLPRVAPARSQDSSFLAPFAEADCLIVRAPSAPALAAGASVPILPLDF